MQIENLKHTLHELEQKKAELDQELKTVYNDNHDKMAEIDNLKREVDGFKAKAALIPDKEKEIENWKNRYQLLDKSRTKEIEDLKAQSENNTKIKLVLLINSKFFINSNVGTGTRCCLK